jgi:hypothetical protein
MVKGQVKEGPMFAAILLSVSVVALTQFALYYWRAVLASVAGQPVSEGVLAAARVDNRLVTGEDFETFASLHELTPTLDPRAGGLGFVKTYFSIINKVATMASDLVRCGTHGLREVCRGADRYAAAVEPRNGRVVQLQLRLGA